MPLRCECPVPDEPADLANRVTPRLRAVVRGCVVHSLTAEDRAWLDHQNPKRGFHVMRLIVARWMRDVQRHRPAAAAPVSA